VILYTDGTDFPASYGKNVKKSVFFREIRVPKILITAIPKDPVFSAELRLLYACLSASGSAAI